MTEIQSVRQKMAEAYHIQRQYKTILELIATERIGYESQLQELEKSIAESKAEIVKLKVLLLLLLLLLFYPFIIVTIKARAWLSHASQSVV